MPVQDVIVNIALEQVQRLSGFGKPLLLARKEGAPTFKNYSEHTDVATDFGQDSVAHKMARTIFGQGDTSTATLAIATYDPTATTPVTAAQVLEQYFGEDFYFAVADTQVIAEQIAIGAVVEAKGEKAYVATNTKANALTFAAEGFKHSVMFAHETVNEYPAEALIGGHGSKPVGSITYHSKPLINITPQTYTAAEVTELETAGINVAIRKANRVVSSNGLTTSGDYIDTVQGIDWLKDRIHTYVGNLFAVNGKIPYTDDGISLVYSEIKNALKEAVTAGVITDDYTITVPKREDTTATTRASRVLQDVKFRAELQGAIHKTIIDGTMSY